MCFGVPVPESIYQARSHPTTLVWRTQSSYYRQLDSLALRCAVQLEQLGAQALPVFGCMPLGLNAAREVYGYLSQVRMGEAAGIGFIGRNRLLMHDRYGARLMLGGVITTAKLPSLRVGATSIATDCRPNCRACIDACPVGAISLTAHTVDINKCLYHTARVPLLPKLRYLMWQRIRPAQAELLLNQNAVDEHTLHVCSKCVSECPLGQAGTTAGRS